jgi:hypothetical protein
MTAHEVQSALTRSSYVTLSLKPVGNDVSKRKSILKTVRTLRHKNTYPKTRGSYEHGVTECPG